MPLTLKEIANAIGAKLEGDPNLVIYGLASLEDATTKDISFLSSDKYKSHLSDSNAGAIILSESDSTEPFSNKLIVDDVYLGFAKISGLLNPEQPLIPGRHCSSQIADSAKIDSSTYIGASVVIGENAKVGADSFIGPGSVIASDCAIGENCRLVANVSVLSGSRIGNNCIIHAGAVIGDDGFGFAKDGNKWLKIPQTGKVMLGDDVEIGSNTTIDCGTISDTFIGNGVKLDNMIHIAHNVKIGANTAMAAKSVVAGSTEIGENCTISGLCGVAGHLKIADNVHIAAMSLVSKSIEKSGTYASSWPVQPSMSWKRMVAQVRRLPDILARLKKVESKI